MLYLQHYHYEQSGRIYVVDLDSPTPETRVSPSNNESQIIKAYELFEIGSKRQNNGLINPSLEVFVRGILGIEDNTHISEAEANSTQNSLNEFERSVVGWLQALSSNWFW